jgi:DNA-binding MarR family transcriptional regulator
MPRARNNEPWPQHGRDPADVALVASRLLVTSGRLSSRLRRIARKHRIDLRVVRLLLLFSESNRPLRIGNIAESLGVAHSTASRAATKAHAAGLIDKFGTAVDGREVTVRITPAGRAAITRCLDAMRSDAADVLGLAAAATVHPRGDDFIGLLGPMPYLERSSDNWGWRAGVRAGMPDE